MTENMLKADPQRAQSVKELFDKGKISLSQIGEYFFNLLKLRMKKKKKSTSKKAPTVNLSSIKDNIFQL